MTLSDALHEHAVDVAGLEISRTTDKGVNLLKWIDKIDDVGEDQCRIDTLRDVAEEVAAGKRPSRDKVLAFARVFELKFRN